MTPTDDGLDDLTKPELEEMATAQGVTVNRSGGEEGAPLKEDFVRALRRAARKAEREAGADDEEPGTVARVTLETQVVEKTAADAARAAAEKLAEMKRKAALLDEEQIERKAAEYDAIHNPRNLEAEKAAKRVEDELRAAGVAGALPLVVERPTRV